MHDTESPSSDEGLKPDIREYIRGIDQAKAEAAWKKLQQCRPNTLIEIKGTRGRISYIEKNGASHEGLDGEMHYRWLKKFEHFLIVMRDDCQLVFYRNSRGEFSVLQMDRDVAREFGETVYDAGNTNAILEQIAAGSEMTKDEKLQEEAAARGNVISATRKVLEE